MRSYTLAEVVVVMLIIAVIVAVSIRITKAKLDKVVSYTYYSAYSTLADISRSMYLDISGHRVDQDYYLSFVNFIKDVTEDLSVKAASVKLFLKNSFITPAYAASSWSGKVYQFCGNQSEDWLNTTICPDSIWTSPGTTYVSQFRENSLYAVCHNAPMIFQGPNHLPSKAAPSKLNCPGSDTYYHAMAIVSPYSWNGVNSIPSSSYYLRFNPASTYTQFDSNFLAKFDINYYPNKSALTNIVVSARNLKIGEARSYSSGTIDYGSPNWCILKDRYGKCYVGYGVRLHVGSYGTPTLYSCDNKSFFVIHGAVPDPLYTCGDAAPNSSLRKNYVKAGRIINSESGLYNVMYECPEPEQALTHTPIEYKDTYEKLNHYTLSGSCYYAQKAPCGEDNTFYWIGNGSNNQTYGKTVCIPCDSINNYLDHIHQSDWGTHFDQPPYNCKEPQPIEPDDRPSQPITPDEPDEPEEPPVVPEEPEVPVCELDPAGAPCGKQFDEASCSYIDIAGFDKTCSGGYIWNDTECRCIPNVPSLPKVGSKFCELFETYVNKTGAACQGDLIADNTTDFSNKKPDITMRNGIKLYNLSKSNEQLIEDLKVTDFEESEEISDEMRKTIYEQHGYLVYADIDGKNGDSKLWEDVYPFYVTLTGKVIPLFDKELEVLAGANSKNHLEVSVARKRPQRRGVNWIVKSVPFQQAACTAGYVSQEAPYCKDYGYTTDNKCFYDTSNRYSPCKLEIIKPVGLFF